MLCDEVPAFITDKGAVDDVEGIVTQRTFGVIDMGHPVLSRADFPGYHKT